MKVVCDSCGQPTEDELLQIVEQGSDILYVCPECYVQHTGEPPEEQA